MPENKSMWTDEIVYSGLKEAVKKVDFEVTKIRKWDRQGSTVAAVYINGSESEGETENEILLNDFRKDNLQDEGEVENDEDNEEENAVKDSAGMKNYSILTVNVGDSRIVLARNKRAIDLTSDHKPNLRFELRANIMFASSTTSSLLFTTIVSLSMSSSTPCVSAQIDKKLTPEIGFLVMQIGESADQAIGWYCEVARSGSCREEGEGHRGLPG